MTFFSYVKQLIKSNTGESSKGFLLVTVTLASLSLLAICGVSLIIDVIVNGHIVTDLLGMAAFVTSISTLLGAVGLTKVYGDKYDNESYRDISNCYYREKKYKDESGKEESYPCAKIDENEADKVI